MEMSLKVQSVRKAALLLRILATFSPRGASLGEVCQYVGIPKATAHRLLSSLVAERLVERPEGTRLYRLGAELFAIGTGISMMFDFRELASPAVKRICDETQSMVLLGIRSGYDALCVDLQEGRYTPDDALLRLLDRWPLGIGVFSRALLAYLGDDEIRDVLQYNERRLGPDSDFSVKNISESLRIARANKYASLSIPATQGSENKIGLAVPIFDVRNRPIASLAVIAKESRMRGDAPDRVVALLQREAAWIADQHDKRHLDGEPEENWQKAFRNLHQER